MPEQRRVIIVTGGSMGIGKEIARAFAEQDDYIVICARNLNELEQAASEIQKFSGQIVTAACDVSDSDAVQEFVRSAYDRFKRIDVLVNNAGIYGPIGLSFENDIDAWEQTIAINLTGVFLMNRAVIPRMLAGEGGVIINLSGGGATGPKPRYSAYAAAKAAVVRLTETMAVELADKGIRVNAIAPGFIETRFHQETIAAGDAAGADLDAVRKKLERGGDDPRLAAELAVFLASEEGKGITGRLISAVWDDWRNFSRQSQSIGESDLFTLRRIDDVFYQEVPKK